MEMCKGKIPVVIMTPQCDYKCKSLTDGFGQPPVQRAAQCLLLGSRPVTLGIPLASTGEPGESTSLPKSPQVITICYSLPSGVSYLREKSTALFESLKNSASNFLQDLGTLWLVESCPDVAVFLYFHIALWMYPVLLKYSF